LLSIMRREQVVHSLNKPIAFISHEYYTPWAKAQWELKYTILLVTEQYIMAPEI
jgi:hypothetical protein